LNLSNFQLPNQKEWAAGVAGLITWLILIGLTYAGINVPADAQGGIVALVAAIIARITPPADVDVVKHVNDDIAQAGTIVGKLTPASDSTAPVSPDAKALAAKVQ